MSCINTFQKLRVESILGLRERERKRDCVLNIIRRLKSRFVY